MLDTPAERLLDALTAATVAVTGRPIALISLVDAERQWFKANVGLAGVSETSRDSTFCAHTVLGPELMEVVDTLADPRFVDNPPVTGSPRAFAPMRVRRSSSPMACAWARCA